MCNLSEGIEERGRRKGHVEGLKEGITVGRKEGIAVGREEGRDSLLFQLVDEGDLSLEKAAEKANMTVDEFLKKKSEWKGNSPS